MDRTRKPLQGVANIVRFNWPFYALTGASIASLVIAGSLTYGPYPALLLVTAIIIALPLIISLLVSFYVYDLSGLYALKWLDDMPLGAPQRIINVNAGFDETSGLLQQKYRAALTAFDFYDAAKHTEPSIKRARKAYPPYPQTVAISTTQIPVENESVDVAFVLFAAHEIRDDAERIIFFKELRRALTPAGKVVVAEHLRDVPNFLAYNIGFFHFLPRPSWFRTFQEASLRIDSAEKHTPFVTLFFLSKNDGAAS